MKPFRTRAKPLEFFLNKSVGVSIKFTQVYGINATRWFVIAMVLLTMTSGVILTMIHTMSVIGLVIIILGKVIAIKTMMKSDEKLRERHTIYQRLPPVSILYLIGIIVGTILILW